jgi:hypothetical protein
MLRPERSLHPHAPRKLVPMLRVGTSPEPLRGAMAVATERLVPTLCVGTSPEPLRGAPAVDSRGNPRARPAALATAKSNRSRHSTG